MRRYCSLVRHRGNEWLYAAVEMSIMAMLHGLPLHVHAEGLRGTGKTTVMRAARDILPPIERVRGCPYNCRPERPHCPQHKGMGRAELERIGREQVPMPFMEISASAKMGTVIGSIDLGRALDRENPGAALLPGTVARAHRGILFVDEINRLADVSPDLADALLDVMGTKPGRLQIEETGLPKVEMEVAVAVWAASNPDEEPGPLSDVRRQLADRFDLTVPMARPSRAEEVRAILARDPFAADAESAPSNRADGAAERFRAATRRRLPVVPGEILDLLAEAYVRFSLESLRAVEAWQAAARLHALMAGRPAVDRADLLSTAPLALTHRVELAVLGELIGFLQEEAGRPAAVHSVRTAGGEKALAPGTGSVPAGVAAAYGRTTASFPSSAAQPASQPIRGTSGSPEAGTRSPSWWDRLRLKAPAGVQAPTGIQAPAGVQAAAGARLREAAGPPAPADPAQCREFAPPNPARPIGLLREDELVRTPRGLPDGHDGLRA